MFHAIVLAAALLVSSPAPTAPSAAPKRVLREGSHLVQVRGSIAPPAAGERWWSFRVAPDHATLAGYEFSLLPSSKLSEMQRMTESLVDHDVVFEVTGEVFVFQSRNYLLTSHAPLVGLTGSDTDSKADSNHSAPPASAGGGAKIEPGAPGPDPAPEIEPTAEKDSAQDIAKDLEHSVGPAVRSSGGGGGGGGGAEPAASGDAGARTGPLTKEGTMLLGRRGRMVRDAAGGWSFVFDADAAGAADPPMSLLPCLMLERMSAAAARAEGAPAMLVSGRVLTFGGRNWLLPTIYRLPAERTPIKP